LGEKIKLIHTKPIGKKKFEVVIQLTDYDVSKFEDTFWTDMEYWKKRGHKKEYKLWRNWIHKFWQLICTAQGVAQKDPYFRRYKGVIKKS
jgi:hypothetical protein